MAKEYLATQSWVKELFAGGGNLIVTSGKIDMSKGTQNVTIPHPVGLIMVTYQSKPDKTYYIDRNFHTTNLDNLYITIEATFNSANCKIAFTNSMSSTFKDVYYYALS